MYPFAQLPSPVSQLEFYVLLALAQEEAHVYKIKVKIGKDSLGSIKLSDSTIYPLIRRMCERGLIEIAGPRTYCLGHHGRTAIRYEMERLQHAITIAKSAGILEQAIPSDVDLLVERLRSGDIIT